MMRIPSALVGLVARVPARVQSKLLAAFLAIAGLLIMVGAVGLQGLREVNGRTEELTTTAHGSKADPGKLGVASVHA